MNKVGELRRVGDLLLDVVLDYCVVYCDGNGNYSPIRYYLEDGENYWELYDDNFLVSEIFCD